jgi:hypothetical protein
MALLNKSINDADCLVITLLTFLPHSHWLWLDSKDEEVLIFYNTIL